MPAQRRDSFGFNYCSSCEAFTLTFGRHDEDGTRHCRACVRVVPGWLALTAPRRAQLLSRFDHLENQVVVQRLRDKTPGLDDELGKARPRGATRKGG